MSLYDLMLCACRHPRHSHVGQWTKDVGGNDVWHHGECRRCDCKGFLESHAATLTGERP